MSHGTLDFGPDGAPIARDKLEYLIATIRQKVPTARFSIERLDEYGYERKLVAVDPETGEILLEAILEASRPLLM